jgi:hypothetical protein
MEEKAASCMGAYKKLALGPSKFLRQAVHVAVVSASCLLHAQSCLQYGAYQKTNKGLVRAA